MGSVDISMPAAPDIGGGWKETDWDKLLINIEAGTVIPIIGRDLLHISPDAKTKPVLLYHHIAPPLDRGAGQGISSSGRTKRRLTTL